MESWIHTIGHTVVLLIQVDVSIFFTQHAVKQTDMSISTNV